MLTGWWVIHWVSLIDRGMKPSQSWMVTPHCYVGGLCVKDDHLLRWNRCYRVDDGMPKKTWKCFGFGTRAWNSSRLFQRASSPHTLFNHRSTNKLIKDMASGVYWGASHYHTAGEEQRVDRKHTCVDRTLNSPDYLTQKKNTWLLFWDVLWKKEKSWSFAITPDLGHPSPVTFSSSTINIAPAAMQADHKRGSSVMCQCDLESGYWEGLCYNLPYRGPKKEPVF